MDILNQYGPALLRGFGYTILTWALGTVLGMALGLTVALMRHYGPRWLGWIIQIYIEVIRGTPFLVQLFVLYYGGPLIGLRLDALPAGLLGMTIYGSPYFAEIFRAGFRAVPHGQIEAARTIGMTEAVIVRRILLPLSMVSALPALINFSIILTKETVILSIITVPELMYEVSRMSAETFRFVEANLVLALFFWGLVEAISRLGRRFEARVTKHLIERT